MHTEIHPALKPAFEEIIENRMSAPDAPRITVRGYTQCGKTELLLHLKEFYESNGHKVVYLDCQEFRDNDHLGFKLLAEQLGMKHESVDYCDLTFNLGRLFSLDPERSTFSRERHCIVLLDESVVASNFFLGWLRAQALDRNLGIIMVEHVGQDRQTDSLGSPLENILGHIIALDKRIR